MLLVLVGGVMTVQADNTTINIKAASAPNLWTWPADNNSYHYTGDTWPGDQINTTVTVHNQVYYSKTIENVAQKLKFIVSNNGSNQTETISIGEFGTYFYEYSGSSLTEIMYFVVAGDNATLFGATWDGVKDENLMSKVDNNTYSITYSNVNLTAGDIKYKVVKNGFKWLDNDTGNNLTLTIPKNSVYNVTFTINTSTWTISASLEEQITSYYLVGGTTGEAWTVNSTPLTESSGTFAVTLNSLSNYRFAIAPNTAFNGNNELAYWEKVLRPSGSTDTELNFTTNQNGTTFAASQSEIAWKIKYGDPVTVTVSINPSEGTWSFTNPSFTRTINAAASNGKFYATFSSDYNVAVPDGVTAYYASAAGNGSVTMTPFENGIESAQGAFLKLPRASGDYTFTPASSTDNITTNYLAKGTSDGVSSSTPGYNYVFARQQGVVGFYKVGTTATGSLEGKAYLHSDASLTTTTAPYLSIDLDGETTGIKVIDDDFMQPASNNGATYDLSGRRVENMTKGIYIVNGKKVIVK